MKPKDKNRVVIFDTTLRDGEQCPGASMGIEEKMQVARQLARLKVDIIEAGFPIASPGDFQAVQTIAEKIRGPRICALARCIDKDIDAAGAALESARKARIHVFLATSAIHRKFKLKKAKSEIIKQAVHGVSLAKKYVDDVQFSPEDASRTEPEFMAEVVKAVIEAGATTINIPDTVGYAVPHEFGATIAELFQRVPELGNLMVHVHCHNDLGLAVANSLEAVRHGARGIECTINGIGERAGNASLEEVVMAMRTRKDSFGGTYTGINTEELYRASRMVTQMTGMLVQRNKAVVGANAFAHEAGIHQDGILKKRETYEIMSAESVGADKCELVLGKHSGRHAFKNHLVEMGYKPTNDVLSKAYEAFIELADKKKNVYDEDLHAIMQALMSDNRATYSLEYLHACTGNTAVPTATIRLRRGEEMFEDAASGDGPVDAALKSIERITKVRGKLQDFTLQAVTKGKDAVGEVSVQVEFPDITLSGKGSSTDIVEASARAYLNCVNRYLNRKETPEKKTRPKKTRSKKVARRSRAKT